MSENRKQQDERIANQRHARLVVSGSGLVGLNDFDCEFMSDTEMWRISHKGVTTFHATKEETTRAMFGLAAVYQKGR